MSLISVIIPSHNEGNNLKKTVDSVIKNTNFDDYEIIVVDDASDDGSTGFLKGGKYENVKLIKINERCPAKARNIGAENAVGDFLIFLDAHVFPLSKEWMSKIAEFLDKNPKTICGPCISTHDNPDSKGYGCTINGPKLGFEWLVKNSDDHYEVPIVGAACMGIKKTDFFYLGGFNKNFISWGHEDVEFCIRSWLLGYRVFVLPYIEISHIFRPEFPYVVNLEDTNYNLLVTAELHFDLKKKFKVMKAIKEESDIKNLFDIMEKNSISVMKRELDEKRIYTDEWFFKKFNINF